MGSRSFMRSFALPWAVLGVGLMLVGQAAWAQEGPKARLDVPAPLEPWVPWVLYGSPDLDCARWSQGSHQCVWPGFLEVEADAKGARFSLSVWLDREGLVVLPGDGAYWPQGISSQSGSLVVQKTPDARPAVLLPKGQHTVTGSFAWSSAPQVLPVPPQVGEVSLSVQGAAIERPRFDAEGRLWLQAGGEGGGEEAEADSVRVSVYRQFYDGVPLRVTSRFDLNVSGRAREVELGAVLLGGARPTQVRGELPVQVQPDGKVKVYVRPGTHSVEVDAVLTEPPAELKAPARSGDFFDPQEVWVWRPDATVRAVELSGLQAVDPERTTLPEAWRGGSTFLAEPGQGLVLTETRRGELETAPNALRLDRTLWLDLDGEGYTVRDQLNGTMNQGWRLNHKPDGVLGRVNRVDTGADLLITQDPDSKQSGVELRDASVSLQAELRLEDDLRSLGAVGWDHDMQQLTAHLHLPPGWELLGGRGVDQMKGTWVESWTLFDFFFLLMVSLSLGKLCGWRWAPVAALALCLSHGHEDAPRWAWIQLLAALALLRVLPEGWIRKGVLVYRFAVLVVLALLLAPYAREQVRFALHPQVEHGGAAPNAGFPQWDNGTFSANMQSADVAITRSPEAPAAWGGEGFDGKPMEQEEQIMDKLEEKSGKQRSNSIDLWANQKKSQLQQIDPNSVVQTGPGVPTWEWRTWNLTWTGPVRKDHEVQLWLMSPMLNRVATLVRVALLILLGLLLIQRRDMAWVKRKEGEPEPTGGFWRDLLGKSAALLLAGGLAWASLAPQAHAQEVQAQGNQDLGGASAPSGELLGELRERLLAQDGCEGPCVVASRADFEITEQELVLRAEVHVQKLAGWWLPGPTEALQLVEVKVNGVPTRQLRREPGGLTAVRLEPGRHTVELRGRLAGRNVVTLQLDEATKPQLVTFKSEAWTVDGLGPTGVPDSSLQLTRRQSAGGAGKPTPDGQSESELPPWYGVRREVVLGLPWQLRTEVTRDNAERPQLVKLPLVEGEKVITEGVRVEGGLALVDFPRGESVVSYTSEIPVTPTVKLTAAKDSPWTETWSVECGQVWRCGFEGLPPVASVNGGSYAPRWLPWPGESLTIGVVRPEGTPGQAATVDEVRYEVTPGRRLLEARLELTVRASQGGWQKITLPEGAELQAVTIGGEAHNIRPQDGVVSVPVKPGKQTLSLQWQLPWERKLIETLPSVQVGSKAVNATMRLTLGDDRWLLWTYGPSWGPTVLYWSHVAVLLLLAILLGRMKMLPLKTWEWLLLALGMAQLPVVAMLPVVAWFVVLAWRQHTPRKEWWQFDLLQLTLLGMTLVALGCLYAAIHSNLLFDPDMQVRGAGSDNHSLVWYVDQTEGTLPSAGIVSAPLLAWRLLMLVWALWLVARLLKWLPWGWRAFSAEGLWRAVPPSKPRAALATAGVAPAGPVAPAAPAAPAEDAGGEGKEPTSEG